MRIKRGGITWTKFNKARRTPRHKTKSHAVLVRHKGRVKLVRFGAQGATTYPPRKGESQAAKQKRAAWYARHRKSIQRGPLHPAYWSARVKW